MIAWSPALILNGPHDTLINIKARRHELGWQVKRRQQPEGVHGMILMGHPAAFRDSWSAFAGFA